MEARLRRLITAVVLASTLLAPISGFAQQAENTKPAGKISGYVFGDYYYVVNNHLDSLKDHNGFWMRRIYFTYDLGLTQEWDVRFRLEMNNKGDFTTVEKLVPFVKDAYLRWKRGRHAVIVGISASPTWDVVEESWGYRWLEKTPLDLQKMGSSREFGLAAKGSIDAEKKVRYHLMVGNGKGEQSETNKYKKFLGSLGLYPNSKVIVEIYGDYEASHGRTDRYTVQGFAAYKSDRYRVGAQFAHQIKQGVDASGDDADRKLDVASVFATVKVSPKVNAVARVDRTFQANPEGPKIAFLPFDGGSKSTFLVFGVDVAPTSQVHLMPNVEVVAYDKKNGTGPDSDFIGRLTFYFTF